MFQACSHQRQAADLGGSDGYVFTRLDTMLPCADPRCEATVMGGNLIVPTRAGRHEERLREFTRVAGPDGWSWEKVPTS